MLSIRTFDLGQPGRLKLGMIKCIIITEFYGVSRIL